MLKEHEAELSGGHFAVGFAYGMGLQLFRQAIGKLDGMAGREKIEFHLRYSFR